MQVISGVCDLQKSNVVPITLLRNNRSDTPGMQQKRAGALGLRRLQYDMQRQLGIEDPFGFGV
jgi:hypothetical protein